MDEIKLAGWQVSIELTLASLISTLPSERQKFLYKVLMDVEEKAKSVPNIEAQYHQEIVTTLARLRKGLFPEAIQSDEDVKKDEE